MIDPAIYLAVALRFMTVQAEHRIEQVAEVANYIAWFLPHHKRRRRESFAVVSLLVQTSNDYGLDPKLIAVVITCESSWKSKAIGKTRERGLMQVHGVAAHGFDVRTVEGQIEAGVSWLASRVRKCKTLEKALSAYQTGWCRPILRSARMRVRLYSEAIERFGGQYDDK